MSDLNFYWRMGDYALEAVPRRLARLYEDEPNETIDLVKYYQCQGKECKYSIGYFIYDSHEPCWELRFVGGRFKELLETDIVAVFKMLKSAYDTLEEWSERQEDEKMTDDWFCADGEAKRMREFLLRSYTDDEAEVCKRVGLEEVVRCKDCKWLHIVNDNILYGFCTKGHAMFYPFQLDSREFYCADGERRDPCSSQDS